MQNLQLKNSLILVLTLAVSALFYLGMQLPNHFYQFLLGGLILFFLYHKKILAIPKKPFDYLLVGINFIWFSFLLKLFIGLGEKRPLFWLQYPTWPKPFQFSWEPSSLAGWTIDLTMTQTFLLIVTLMTGWLKFQPFASFAALALILFCVPTWIGYEWVYVMPAVILSIANFYLQTADQT